MARTDNAGSDVEATSDDVKVTENAQSDHLMEHEIVTDGKANKDFTQHSMMETSAGDVTILADDKPVPEAATVHSDPTPVPNDISALGDTTLASDDAIAPPDHVSARNTTLSISPGTLPSASTDMTTGSPTPTPENSTPASDNPTPAPDNPTPAHTINPSPDTTTPADSCDSAISDDDDQLLDTAALRQRLQHRSRQLRGLKRRLTQLQRENAALRMRADLAEANGVPEATERGQPTNEAPRSEQEVEVSSRSAYASPTDAPTDHAPTTLHHEPPTPLDAASLVEDIKRAAAETAAQLEPTTDMTYQPETGLYYHHQSGYYWDSERQMYYDGNSGYYLRYDEATGAYSYAGSSADGTAEAVAEAGVDRAGEERSTSGGSGDPPEESTRRQRSEELEEGELESDDEEGQAEQAVDYSWTPVGRVAHHRDPSQSEQDREAARQAILDYWTPERMRQARPEPTPDYSAYSLSADPPAAISSGPRSPQGPAREPPWLRMIVTETAVKGLTLGSLHVATIDGMTAGRDPSQQLWLDDPNLSKFHARIGYSAELNDYYVRDMGSRNGTLVDGRRISVAKQESEDVSLPHGCLLKLGSTCLSCHVHAANETCLECEPGQMKSRLAQHEPVAPTVDTQEQRRQVAERIKQKYQLRPGDGAPVKSVTAGVRNRAAERRRVKGSAHSAEKTQTADVRQALPAKNKGRQLMQKMGWKEGTGLGKAEQGRVEPINVEERGERRGLGCEMPVAPSVSQQAKRKTEVWQKTQARFKKL